MHALVSGFLFSLSLIAAIGAQNAFVLRQGLQRQHVWPVSLICAGSDAVLISAGVAGFGALAAMAPWLETAMTLGGAAFVLFYGIKSFYAAARNSAALKPCASNSASLSGVIASCLAFTWLNPHVYLDTLVLLGSISAHYGAQRYLFGLGAITASFVFFLALGFGARFLAPIFAAPRAWQILDFCIGVMMTSIAYQLLARFWS